VVAVSIEDPAQAVQETDAIRIRADQFFI